MFNSRNKQQFINTVRLLCFSRNNRHLGRIMSVMINELKPQGIKPMGRDCRLTLLADETEVFGSNTRGNFFVQCFEDGLEMSGSFWDNADEAKIEIKEWTTQGRSLEE